MEPKTMFEALADCILRSVKETTVNLYAGKPAGTTYNDQFVLNVSGYTPLLSLYSIIATCSYIAVHTVN